MPTSGDEKFLPSYSYAYESPSGKTKNAGQATSSSEYNMLPSDWPGTPGNELYNGAVTPLSPDTAPNTIFDIPLRLVRDTGDNQEFHLFSNSQCELPPRFVSTRGSLARPGYQNEEEKLVPFREPWRTSRVEKAIKKNDPLLTFGKGSARKIAKATGPKRKLPKPRKGNSPTPYVSPVVSQDIPVDSDDYGYGELGYLGDDEGLSTRRRKRKAVEEQSSEVTESTQQSEYGATDEVRKSIKRTRKRPDGFYSDKDKTTKS